MSERRSRARAAFGEFKKHQRDRLAMLCGAAGASQPGLLADTIVLLI